MPTFALASESAGDVTVNMGRRGGTFKVLVMPSLAVAMVAGTVKVSFVTSAVVATTASGIGKTGVTETSLSSADDDPELKIVGRGISTNSTAGVSCPARTPVVHPSALGCPVQYQ
jgi:hypothetical protein